MSDEPMTTGDWLRAYGAWVTNDNFGMLNGEFLEEAADEWDYLRARVAKLEGVLNSIWLTAQGSGRAAIKIRDLARAALAEEGPHTCPRCGEPNPEHMQIDGCRDPDCPEIN